MGDIFKFSGPYLYPFVIEYSLIAAAVMFAMWKNIGNNPRYYSLTLIGGGGDYFIEFGKCEEI